jgi:hypothetical protein
MSGISDPYREYPLRIVGYSNSFVRPWKEFLPKSVYQLSLGVMHTYFITNSYDYARRIDSKSPFTSAFDCYSWHCVASWVAPAIILDNSMRLMKNVTTSKLLRILVGYSTLAILSPLIDKATNWYFYGFWSAGNKERPILRL